MERTVLLRLAIFPGAFSLDAMSGFAAAAHLAVSDVVACIAELTAKSFISADIRGPTTTYRMLETTRAYARERLAESGEIGKYERRLGESIGGATLPAVDQSRR